MKKYTLMFIVLALLIIPSASPLIVEADATCTVISGGTGNGTIIGKIDLSKAKIENSPNVSDWAQTTSITGVNFQKNSTSLDFSKKQGPNRWPDQDFIDDAGDADGDGVIGQIYYTIWFFVKIDGQWVGSGFNRSYVDQAVAISSPLCAATDLYYAQDRWGSMFGHKVKPGEEIGYMVTAGDARNNGAGGTTVFERSDAVIVKAPLGTVSVSGSSTNLPPTTTGNAVISSVSPTTAKAGVTTLTITGTNLTNQVSFYDGSGGRNTVTGLVNSAKTQTTVLVPVGQPIGNATVKIYQGNQVWSNGKLIAITSSTGGGDTHGSPVVTSVSPMSAVAGTTVLTITGTNLTSTVQFFDGSGGRHTVVGDVNGDRTWVKIKVPEGIPVGNATVKIYKDANTVSNGTLIAITAEGGEGGGGSEGGETGGVEPLPPIDSDCISFANNLRYKDSDATTNGEVSILQGFLYSKKYLLVEPTGYFGPLTLKSVKSFQREYGLAVDGKVGPITKAKIKALTCDGTISPPVPPLTPLPIPPLLPPTTSSSVTVLSPNGGEAWTKETEQVIRWIDSRDPQNCNNCGAPLPKYYDITLKLANLSTIYKIANRVSGTSYPWKAGKVIDHTSDYITGSSTIKICQTGTDVCDSSDTSFRVVSNSTCGADGFNTTTGFRCGCTSTSGWSVTTNESCSLD